MSEGMAVEWWSDCCRSVILRTGMLINKYLYGRKALEEANCTYSPRHCVNLNMKNTFSFS